MKKTYLFLCLAFVLGISIKTVAQTDPGTTNLTHQWTFDDGTAKDNVGTADGTLMGGAVCANKALNTLGNGYLVLPADQIGINAYPEITMEIWFTSGKGLNTGWSMLSFFGNTVSGGGSDYTFISTARGDDKSLAAIECGGTGFNGAWGTEYDDGILHHMVSVINATSITFYIDGVNVQTTTLATGTLISNLSNTEAYLGRGGWTGDPNWLGNIHKFSLYNRALIGDEVLYLFQKGPEKDAVITGTVSSLAFDENYPAETFNISSTNLTIPIAVTSPAGIIVLDGSGNPLSTIQANEANVSVTAVFDGTTSVDGNLTFTSGSTVVNIPVKSASDAACYSPMYQDGINLIDDPGLNSLSKFQGWGARTVETIITDPADVYCGAATMKVGDGINTGTGSLDQSLAATLVKNTVYKGKAMVKTVDGSFQIGLSGTDPDLIVPINTNGEWKEVDFTFTTGANMTATPFIYFNNWTCTGKTAFIDNYQIYVAENPVISVTAKSYVADDKSGKNFVIKTLAANLKHDITITAPAGIVVSPSVISKDSLTQQPFTATYDGTTAVDGNIVLTSDTVVVKIAVKSDNTSSTCYTPLYTDRPNLNPDPYMNNTSAGWGTHDLIQTSAYPDSVFCGLSAGRIAGGGDFDVALTGKLKVNTDYVAKASVLTYGVFQMGVFGVDSVNTADISDSIDTKGVWETMTFNFKTGVGFKVGGSQGLYFNNYLKAGTRAFIDNWDIYEAPALAIPNVSKLNTSIFVNNGRIVAKFELANASPVRFDVYNVQGLLLATDKVQGVAGSNYRVLDATLPSGVYLVKMTQNGQSGITKLVK